jgi:L-threonylcarbamoyladenylate synthase
MTYKGFSDPGLAALINHGGVGVLPTDTQYGLVAQASDPVAVARLYLLKNRRDNPGTLIAADIDQLVELGLKKRYLKAVEDYWPGAISVVIPCGPELAYLHQGKSSLAVRIPRDKQLRDFLQITGALLTSSANRPGEDPAGTVQQAEAIFGDSVAFYCDGGDKTGNRPSTVIRIVDDAVEVLREGAVTIDENGKIKE